MSPLQKGLFLTQKRKVAKIFKKMLDFLSASSNFFLILLSHFLISWRLGVKYFISLQFSNLWITNRT